MSYNTKVEVRMTEEDKRKLEEAAWLTRRSLSEWVRRTLVMTAEAQIEKGAVQRDS